MRRLFALSPLFLFTACGGLTAAGDPPVTCDPADPTCVPTEPAGSEDCTNGVDDDGDGDVDCEDSSCADKPACDSDGDGHADIDKGGDDCDDGDDTVYPGAPELCDTLDNNCDDTVDEDSDGDGSDACADCDNGDDTIFPGAQETCDDGVDSDCDGADCAVNWTENFETGTIGNGITNQDAIPWLASATAYSGAYGAECGNIGTSGTTCMSVVLNYAADGDLSFYYSTDSESGFDYLSFTIDGVQPLGGGSWSGVTVWAWTTYPVSAGTHTMQWCYSKDGSVDAGLDTVWVDEIVATGGML